MVIGSLISPLSLSLWWPHGCGFCSGSVLIWIGDRGYGFFVGVLEFCRFWFGLLVWVCCGWSVADCQKPQRRSDEDFVGLKCL